jgi:hypothetical protein
MPRKPARKSDDPREAEADETEEGTSQATLQCMTAPIAIAG